MNSNQEYQQRQMDTLQDILDSCITRIQHLDAATNTKHHSLVEDLYEGIQITLGKLETVRKELCPPPPRVLRIYPNHVLLRDALPPMGHPARDVTCYIDTSNIRDTLRGFEPFDEVYFEGLSIEEAAEATDILNNQGLLNTKPAEPKTGDHLVDGTFPIVTGIKDNNKPWR